MLIVRAIIVSTFLSIIAAVCSAISEAIGNPPPAEPWVIGVTLFGAAFVLGIIKPVLISGWFEHERWGSLRLPPDNSDVADPDSAEERISEKS